VAIPVRGSAAGPLGGRDKAKSRFFAEVFLTCEMHGSLGDRPVNAHSGVEAIRLGRIGALAYAWSALHVRIIREAQRIW
jgi:hypothetical protein